MSRLPADEDDGWQSALARLSAAGGVLFYLCYAGYVVTGWGRLVAVPPVVLVAALLYRGSSWSAVVDGASTRQFVAVYAVFLPAGVVAVEAALLLAQAVVFTAFGWVPAVAGYHGEWLGVVGVAGPVPLLGYTLLSTAVASLLALAIRTLRTRARGFSSHA